MLLVEPILLAVSPTKFRSIDDTAMATPDLDLHYDYYLRGISDTRVKRSYRAR